MPKYLTVLFLIFCSLSAAAQQNTDETLAAQYFQSGEFEKAAALYQKLFNPTRNPNYYDPYFNSLLRLRQYPEAERLARQMHRADPQNNSYAVDIGRTFQERGQPEAALAWYNQLISALPDNEFIIRDLANAFYRAEAYDLSIKTLVNGRRIMKNEKAFAFDLISLYRYRKDKVMLVQEYLNVLANSPEVLPQAENAFSGIFEENSDYEMLKTALLRQLQKNPQNIAYAELLTWQYIQQKEFDMALKQTLALDKRLKEEGLRVYNLSRMLSANQAYEQAIDALNYIISKGAQNTYYLPARIDLLQVKMNMLPSGKLNPQELEGLEKDYQFILNEFGRTAGTSFAILQLADLQAYYLHKPLDAAAELEKLIKIPGLSPQIIPQAKLRLGDIYILTNEVWEAALIYGQVEKEFANEPAGQEAKFRNARLSYFQGDFTWAKAQLDVIKASTSQLFANDALNLELLISDNLQNETDTAALRMYARADLQIFRNQPQQALKILDSIDQQFAGHSLADDILMARAKIYINAGDYPSAAGQLQKIIDHYAFDLWADDALFGLADLFENKLNQPLKAAELYQKIINDYPSSLFVNEARKRFRSLRGDKIG